MKRSVAERLTSVAIRAVEAARTLKIKFDRSDALRNRPEDIVELADKAQHSLYSSARDIAIIGGKPSKCYEPNKSTRDRLAQKYG